MRKNIILLSLGILAVACTDMTEPEMPVSGTYMTFGARGQEHVSTRTMLQDDMSVAWEEGDAVAVFDDDCRKWTMSDMKIHPGDPGIAYFSGECKPESAWWYGVYPASAAEGIDDDGKMTVVLPSQQNARAGSFAADMNLAVAYTRNAEDGLNFKNVCGLLAFTVKNEGIRKIELKAAEKASGALCGTAVVSMEAAGAPRVEAVTSAEGSVVLSGDFEKGKTYYMAVFPGEYSHLTLTFTDELYGTAVYTSEDPLVVESNTVTVVADMEIPEERFVYESLWEGDGTEASPYLISDAQEFMTFVRILNLESAYERYAGCHYSLVASIDLKDTPVTPVGAEASRPFRGVFDGNSNTIFNLQVDHAGTSASGLFGYAEDAVIRDLVLENSDIESDYIFCGNIAGHVRNSVIEDIRVKGKIRAYTSGIAVDASEYAPVRTNNAGYNGGVVGLAMNSTVRNCRYDGTVNFYGKFSGGVVGVSYDSVIENCAVEKESTVNVYYHFSGGVVGRAMGADNLIKGCSFEGNFTSVGYCSGGIVGQLLGGAVEDCVLGSYAYFGADKHAVGGIVGSAQPLNDITVKNCASYGTIRGAYSVGGIVGYAGIGQGADSDKDLMLNASGDVTIRDCAFVQGSVTATSAFSKGYALAGGIIGWGYGDASQNITVAGCYSRPGLIQTTYGSNVNGVLAGISAFQHNVVAVIENCYSSFTNTDMLVCSEQAADGLRWVAGVHVRSCATTTIRNCYSDTSLPVGSQNNGNETGCDQYDVTQMTDGTLLAALQNGSTGTVWTAGADGYPTVSGLPADPNVKPVAKKRVSIIGDSISTFKGWIPGGYSAHYPATDGTLTLVNETYWYRLIHDYMESAQVEVNIAFSGSTVTNTTEENYTAKYGDAANAWWHNSFSERFAACGGVGNPDIIIVHGGTNDWAHDCDPLAPGVAIRNDASNIYGGSAPSEEIMNGIYAEADAARTRAQINALPDGTFCQAYCKLMCQIRERYPQCKVVCIIGDYLNSAIEQSIIQMAEHYGARTVNLFRVNGFNDLGGYSPTTLANKGTQPNMPKHDYSGATGGCHPGSEAMAFMAAKIYDELGAWLEE